VAVSAHLRRALEQAGVPAQRIHTIPNGVDTALFAPPSLPHSREPRPARGARVVFVGRLVEEKALPVLLRAWAAVTERIAAATLDIVGAGPLQAELRALAARLGITSTVTFHGFHDDVTPFLWAADVFVLPSVVEGLSNALLEAMAAGLPVVATRISGTEDVVVHGETGLLVPADDADALAGALTSLLAAPERAREMGRRARDQVIRQCGLDLVAAAYVALYDDLVEEPSVASG
jgi:glycosyltransferase involved in cell wall biosynthesis